MASADSAFESLPASVGFEFDVSFALLDVVVRFVREPFLDFLATEISPHTRKAMPHPLARCQVVEPPTVLPIGRRLGGVPYPRGPRTRGSPLMGPVRGSQI